MFQRNILNVAVDFPYDPYAMQLSMMTRIIAALNSKGNCLLESPTGTGKTMALLCSSLSWVESQKNKTFKQDDDKNATSIPKIYFGTRTHKQIGQVVREMSRSSYSHMPMTILSSRKQSCVNKQVLKKVDINQACHDSCKNKSCEFKIKQNSIPSKTWDLESMKVVLKKRLLCPFYQSRAWCKEASIVFCPYNYILNPSIRESMSIDLRNTIVILDEGHNIEDICREGASTELNLETLNEYKLQFMHLLKSNTVASHASHLLVLIKSLTSFIEALASRLVFIDEDILKKTWESSEAVSLMKEHKLDLDSVKSYKGSINHLDEMIKKEETSEIRDHDLPPINTTILNILSSSLTIFEYILNEPNDCQSDFKVVVMESGTYTEIVQDVDISQQNNDGFLSTQNRKRKNQQEKPNFILNILCMNPGIVFKDIAALTHSIILTSGTLAPLSSFQRELSCKFDSTLEAGHVVKLSQTLIASVSCGPRGIRLNGTYKNVETYAFQDELGGLLLSCCKTVPHGVLCFVSSFHMIDKLFKRWQDTELVGEIKKHKTIVIEPRNSVEMDECMKTYYSCIEKGVIMLAVYRGKASEGMDFSDDAARLVIAVGIPFPSFTDFKVNLKKEYNDNKYKLVKEKTEFLSGKEWYSIQAFRALNQAIGRCIRHKDDWGAMILVDERFESEYYSKGLCKWIKMRRKHFNIWPEFLSTLTGFVETQTESIEEAIENI